MVVLLRLDEFYFCLDQDAEALEKITGCDRETEGTRTMARFNFYSLDLYLHKIVKAGLRVAICDELENPEKMLFT
jgi:DNA mismatch repair protein MutS